MRCPVVVDGFRRRRTSFAERNKLPEGRNKLPAEDNKVSDGHISLPGHDISLPGNHVLHPAHDISLLEEDNKLPADDVSRSADVISRPAEVVSPPAHQVSLPNMRVALLAERWLVPRPAERVSRKMRWVFTATDAATAAMVRGSAMEDSVPGFETEVFGDLMEFLRSATWLRGMSFASDTGSQ